MQYPRELLRRFKSKVFQVHNIDTGIGVKSKKRTQVNGYKSEHDFIRTYKGPKGGFSIKLGILNFKQRLCVRNISLRDELFHDSHEISSTGHVGERKTLHRKANYTTARRSEMFF